MKSSSFRLLLITGVCGLVGGALAAQQPAPPAAAPAVETNGRCTTTAAQSRSLSTSESDSEQRRHLAREGPRAPRFVARDAARRGDGS